jgi:hypothetical protein
MVKQLARENECDGYVFTSQPKSLNEYPLGNFNKLLVLKEAFGDMTFMFRRFCDVVSFIVDAEYDSAVLVIGEDRLADFKRMLPIYAAESPFPIQLSAISGGKRNPEASDFIETLSSTQMRKWAKEGNEEMFRAGLPDTISPDTHEYLFNNLKFAK